MAKKRYVIIREKSKKKKVLKEKIIIRDGYGLKSRKKSFMIKEIPVTNIKVTNKNLIHNLVKNKVYPKYEKLLRQLITLLIMEDETGDSTRLILDQIEKFRQEIRIKYRMYLTKKELDEMAKQLVHIKKQAEMKYIIIMNQSMFEMPDKEITTTGKSM